MLPTIEIGENGSQRPDRLGRDGVDDKLDVGDPFAGERPKRVGDLGG